MSGSIYYARNSRKIDIQTVANISKRWWQIKCNIWAKRKLWGCWTQLQTRTMASNSAGGSLQTSVTFPVPTAHNDQNGYQKPCSAHLFRIMFRIFPEVCRKYFNMPNNQHNTSRTYSNSRMGVLQGSNLEMVDRGVLDRVPDVLESWNLKCATSRTYSTSRMGVKNHLSSKDPTWR